MESLHFFSTEPPFLIPPDSNQRLPEAKGSGLPESKPAVFCSRSPFLILFNFTGDPWPHPSFLPQRVR